MSLQQSRLGEPGARLEVAEGDALPAVMAPETIREHGNAARSPWSQLLTMLAVEACSVSAAQAAQAAAAAPAAWAVAREEAGPVSLAPPEFQETRVIPDLSPRPRGAKAS